MLNNIIFNIFLQDAHQIKFVGKKIILKKYFENDISIKLINVKIKYIL